MIIQDFKMRIPKLDAKKTPPNVAIVAKNCTAETGVLKPLAGPDLVHTIPKPGAIRSIYKCGSTWLGFTSANMSFVRAPSESGRVYYTGDGYPKHTDEDLCIAGGVPSLYPSTTWRMGVSRPEAALSLALEKYDDGIEYGEIIGVASYRYSYVHYIDSGYMEESAPSPPSMPVPIRSNEQVTLSGFVPSTQAGVNNLYYRVYRSLDGGEYEAVPVGRDGNGDFIFDMSVADDEFIDIDVQTNEIYQNVNIVCAVLGWDALPDTAANLCQFQNGIMAATYGRKVLFSELFVRYAFPQGLSDTKDYSVDLPSEPVRIAPFNEMLIVGMAGKPYVISGADPSSMQLSPLEYPQSCIGDMCSTEVGVFYPSPDGLVLCDGVTAIPVTTDTFSISQWRALNPANLKLFYHNDKLIGFFKGTSTGIIFDFKVSKDIVDIDLGDIVFYDGHLVPGEDKLYILGLDDGSYHVYEWEGGSLMTMEWKSRFPMKSTDSFYEAYRVQGQYSVSTGIDLSITIDGTTHNIDDVTDAPGWTGINVGGVECSVSVSGTATVERIRLGHNPDRLLEE